jgi:uncharacterized protein with FMN-binding domain
MKRAPWYVLTGAVAGFAAVLGLHGNGRVPVAFGTSKPAAGARGTGGHARPASTPSGQRAGAAGASGPAAPAGVHSATGALEQYGYGELAVRVTVDGNQITAVSVPTLRTAEPYSQQLAQQVIPMLRSQVLTARGARIDGISGATYTSEAYAASLQAALDKLHMR